MCALARVVFTNEQWWVRKLIVLAIGFGTFIRSVCDLGYKNWCGFSFIVLEVCREFSFLVLSLFRGATREKALASLIDVFNSNMQHEYVEKK